MATNDPERSNSEQQSPLVAASDSSIPQENKTEDAPELAVWKLESDRKTWEDHLCPVWNKALRDEKTVDTKPDRFRGYHKLPITHYRTLADRYKQKDHNIKVAVWVPKHPGMEKCPILVKFHGGGLVRETVDVF